MSRRARRFSTEFSETLFHNSWNWLWKWYRCLDGSEIPIRYLMSIYYFLKLIWKCKENEFYLATARNAKHRLWIMSFGVTRGAIWKYPAPAFRTTVALIAPYGTRFFSCWIFLLIIMQLMKTRNANYLPSPLCLWNPVPVKSLSTSLALLQICSANSVIVVGGMFPHWMASQVWYLLSLPKHGLPPFSGLQNIFIGLVISESSRVFFVAIRLLITLGCYIFCKR